MRSLRDCARENSWSVKFVRITIAACVFLDADELHCLNALAQANAVHGLKTAEQRIIKVDEKNLELLCGNT